MLRSDALRGITCSLTSPRPISWTLSVTFAWLILLAGPWVGNDGIGSAVGSEPKQPRITFLNDVGPILTKLACNSGGCHGKSTGQNGFRLSLLGFEPAFDLHALLHEGRGRRIFVSEPHHSLLLQKAAGRVPHGGGKRLEVDSEDYQVLYDWISQGAAGPRDDDPRLERITVFPVERILGRGAKQPLLVTAHFSDGTSRDVTRRAVYDSNFPELATADDRGLVTTQAQSGLFAIMVRFGGAIAVFRGTVPIRDSQTSGVPTAVVELPTSSYPEIDRHLVALWNQLGSVPSAQTDDATFIRRVTIDICGTLPTPAETTEYVTNQRSDKKSQLIKRLLERPEYAAYFSQKWADILRNRGQGYSTSHQRPATMLFAAWIRDSFAANKSYDRFAMEILTATGSQERNPATLWYRHVRTTQDYVESISQAFLGCACNVLSATIIRRKSGASPTTIHWPQCSLALVAKEDSQTPKFQPAKRYS